MLFIIYSFSHLISSPTWQPQRLNLTFCYSHIIWHTRSYVHVSSGWIWGPDCTSLLQRILQVRIYSAFQYLGKGALQCLPSQSISVRVLQLAPNPKGLSHQSWHVCMPIPEYVCVKLVICASSHILYSLWPLLSQAWQDASKGSCSSLTRRWSPGLWYRQYHLPSLLEFAQRVQFKPSFRAHFISKAVSSHEVTTVLN